ncbi:MAG: NHLP leader peptide family natural product precursor [Chloroflexi bacterium]|nr:NHLP leader peptide family natural product precursor [Chloroflexota bacterium]
MEAQPTRAQMQQRIIEHAMQDSSFRQKLVDNPRAAVKEFLGVELPSELNLHVLETTPSQYHIVVPKKPQAIDGMTVDEVRTYLSEGGEVGPHHTLFAKVWADPEFQSALNSQPKATIEHELGLNLPDGVQVSVHYEDADDLYLVLPLDKEAHTELSDEELEMISGGGTPSVLTGLVSAVTFQTVVVSIEEGIDWAISEW